MEVQTYLGGEDRNFSYLIYNEDEAVVVDPFEDINQYLTCAKELEVEIIGVLNTHTHADHTAGNKAFRMQNVQRLQGDVDVGNQTIREIATPGHTNDSVCYYGDKKLFTGDTLFVGKIGHARDKEQAKKQYESLEKLLELPPETVVYPGHDFGVKQTSTLEEEKNNNPFLTVDTFEEFWNLKQNWQEYKQQHEIA